MAPYSLAAYQSGEGDRHPLSTYRPLPVRGRAVEIECLSDPLRDFDHPDPLHRLRVDASEATSMPA